MSHRRIEQLRRTIAKARAAHTELIAERRAGIVPRTIKLSDGMTGLRTEHAIKLACKQLRASVHDAADECRRMHNQE
jgi:hypothetical protein